MDDLTRTLQHCLRRHLPVPPDAALDMEEELLLLGLDSMSAIALLLDVEETFGVNFPDEMLDPQIFHTGTTLAAAVRGLVETQAGTAT